MPDDDGFEGDVEVIDECRVPVAGVLLAEGDSMIYVHDLGDDWQHQVALEDSFLEVIFKPGHEEFSYFRGWAGGKFYAEEFDLKAVNEVLERMRWPVKHGR